MTRQKKGFDEMRIEWKPEGEQEEIVQEPIIHESDLTKKEKRQMEKEKLKSMGFTGKLQYIWMYYKFWLLVLILIPIAINQGVSIYKNSKLVTELNVVVIDSSIPNQQETNESVKEALGFTDKYQTVSVEANVYTSGDELEYNSQMVFSTKVGTSYYDVVVLPENLYKSWKEYGYFEDLSRIMDADIIGQYGEAYQEDHLLLKNRELSDMYGVSYEPICVAVMANSQRMDNAVRWIQEYCKVEE
ncbi:MAG: hypothetical protein HUJ72_05950 [Blautia sp.]|nr:hypothetical protein [Blautia sp.]